MVENNKDKTPGRASSQESRNLTECLITISASRKRVDLYLRAADKKLIQEIIHDPIADAQLERHKDWEIIGSVSIKPGSSEEEIIILYYPWGHFQKGDQYFIADFTRLREFVLKTLNRTIDEIH